LQLLIWALENQCPTNDHLPAAAAGGGSIEVMEWLHARQDGEVIWDEGCCATAARGGHIHALQWLRSHGCPWDEFSTSMAALACQFETLKWLRQEGCPWDSMVIYYAATSSKTGSEVGREMLQWAKQHGCPLPYASIM
jgi:hypothetical protein